MSKPPASSRRPSGSRSNRRTWPSVHRVLGKSAAKGGIAGVGADLERDGIGPDQPRGGPASCIATCTGREREPPSCDPLGCPTNAS